MEDVLFLETIIGFESSYAENEVSLNTKYKNAFDKPVIKKNESKIIKVLEFGYYIALAILGIVLFKYNLLQWYFPIFLVTIVIIAIFIWRNR